MAGVDASVVVKDWSWSQFCAGVQEQSKPQGDESEERKKQAVSFSCCEYDPPRRGLANIVEGSIWAIVLDLDRVMYPDRARAYLNQWRHVGWTTWSSEPGKEKWRIVIPGRVDRNGLSQAVATITARLQGIAQVDPSSRDSAHLWFFPWHRKSNRTHHHIWVNEGESWGSGQLTVDFSSTPSTIPEKIGEGGRNTSLHRYLGGPEGRQCGTVEELMDLAGAWNHRLSEPMGPREVKSIVNKKWHWLEHNRPARLEGDAAGLIWTFDELTVIAKKRPLVGDILYPGVTLMSGKMKEGKSFVLAQLATALASGTTFLNGKEFAGFSVPEKQKVVVFAGEDDPQTIWHRIIKNMRAGHLPKVTSGDLGIVFPERLTEVRNGTKADGCLVFESLMTGWYKMGYRVVMLDPLRAFEARLGIREYPGTEGLRNVHTRDFLTMVWYNQLANKFPGLAMVVAMHHGKNKRDHDSGDPGDMIAGTTGLGAGAMTTISLLPMGKRVEDDVGSGPKQRELYIHGRLTREKRLLLEQNERTGLWSCLGNWRETAMNEVREEYFEAIRALGGQRSVVTSEGIAKETGRRRDTIHKVLRRMVRDGATWNGLRVIVQPNKGYRLVAAG